MLTRCRRGLMAVVLILAVGGAARAQSGTWDSPAVGTTSDTNSWLGGIAPLNSPTAVWTMAGLGTDTNGVINDFATGWQLNGIDFASTSLGAYIVVPPPLVTPPELNFAGTNPFFNMNSPGTVFWNTPMTLGAASLDFGGAGSGSVYMSSTLAGANQTITKSGDWRLVLTASNTATLNGNTVWNLNGGTLDINNSLNQLGSISSSTVTLNMNGGTFVSGTSTGSSSVSRSMNFLSGTSTHEVPLIDTTFTAFPMTAVPGATIRKAGAGTVNVTLANPTMGNASVIVAAGQLGLNIDGAVGTGGAITVQNGGSVAFNANSSVSFLGGNNRAINATGFGYRNANSIATEAKGYGAIDTGPAASVTTYNNPINLSGITSFGSAGASVFTLNAALSQTTPDSSFYKDGSSTVTLNAANAYTGSTWVRRGTLVLGGNGTLATSDIQIGNYASSTLNASGRLVLDNSSLNDGNRIANSVPIRFTSGAFIFTPSAAAGSSESLGALTLQSGTNSITVNSGGGVSQVTVASLARQNNSTLVLRGNNLGGTPASGNSNFIVTGPFAAGDFVGDGLAADQTAILRWAAGTTTSAGTTQNQFIAAGPNGLRPLTGAELFNPGGTLSSTANNKNVALSGTTTLGGDAMVNALNLGGFGLAPAADQTAFLRNLSGLTLNQTNTISFNSTFALMTMDYGSQEPIFMDRGTTMSAYVVSQAGLTRSGSAEGSLSSMTFTQPNVIDGPISLIGIGNTAGANRGQIIVDNPSSLGNPANEWNFAGGVLIWRGASDVTRSNTIRIREGGGEINMGAGSTDPGPVFTFNGSLAGSGRLTKSGAGTLVISADNSSNYSGTFEIASGIVSIANANNLGTGDVQLGSGRLLVTGNSTFDANRYFNIAAAGAISVNAGATLAVQGPMVGSSTLTKFGPGVLALEGTNTASSSLVLSGSPSPRQPVGGGGIVLRGADGVWRGTNGTTAASVNSLTSLIFDNSAANNNNRWQDTSGITLQGGTLTVKGNASTPTFELMNTLSVGGTSGAMDWTRSRVTLEPAAGRQMILSPTTLGFGSTRSQLLLTGPIPVGPALSGFLGPNTANLIPRTQPVLAGIGGVGPLTSIVRGSFGDTTPGGNGTGWLAYHPVAGLRLLGPTEYDPTFANGSTSLVNVRTTANVSGIDAATTINSLILSGGHAVSGTGTLTLNSGMVASLGGSANTISVTALSSVANAGNFFVNQDLNLSSNIGSAFANGLHFSGPGTTTLSGTNNHAGATVVTGGTLVVNADNNLGTSLLVLDGATLRFNAAFNTIRTMHVLAGGATIDTQANNIAWGATGTPGIGHTSAVGTTGVGPVAKIGSGTLTFGSLNSSSFFGGLNVQQGTVLFSASTANIHDGSPITIASPATLSFNGATSDTVGSIAGSGTLNVGGGVNFALTVGTSATAAISPDATFSGTITGGAGSSIAKGGQGTWSLNPGATLSNFPGTFAVTGGTLLLGGDALMSTDGVLGNAASAITLGSTITTDPAALLTSGAFTVARPINIPSGSSNNSSPAILGTTATSGTTVFSGLLTANSTAGSSHRLIQITAPAGATVDLQGQIVNGIGTGIPTLELVGAGTVQFSNAGSTVTGRTVLTRGTLALGADGASPSFGPLGATTLLLHGGSIAAAGANRTIFNPMVVNADTTFAGANNLTFNGTMALGFGSRTLTVNNPIVTANGVVSGTSFGGGFGQLIKAGPGRLELFASNTYSGGTTVQAGTLIVSNSTGSGTGTGPVGVNLTATLGGVGSIAGPTTVSGGAFLAPGSSVGVLTVNNNFNLTTGGTYLWDVATHTPVDTTLNSGGSTNTSVHDQLAITGPGLFTGGDIAFVVNELSAPNFTLSETYSWTVVSQAVGTPILGNVTFDLSGAPTFLAYGGAAQLSLTVNSGQVNLNFTPVPEPATVLGICAAVGGLGYTIRRRRSRQGRAPQTPIT